MCRSSIYWKGRDGRLSRYNKTEDIYVLEEIKEVLKDRPSYGYKRVTVMLNKSRARKGLNSFNKKRIYRIMDKNGLLLRREKAKKRVFKKTGEIIICVSNVRWCSDAFEIICFNGERVYVAFALDCHDRECLAHVVRNRPLSAKDIQELMLLSIEKRFKITKAPRRIQWLSDRGAIYRCHETIRMGRYLGLRSCFTAPYTPESNGMSEAFVATMKRDYVYTSDCKDAQTVMNLVKKWIKDYNNVAPHSGLGMKSPVEYRKLINQAV
ncbi:MAG: IS3 family transposase [Bdellovibrionales bacterium]|nr:IS3 family transposase [Bdellovibrionales bacterium]